MAAINSYQADTDRVSLFVNGEEVSVSARHPHLLAALREELGLTLAKDGCSPQGQCGCCTVMIDGKAQVSCTMPLSKAAGRKVTTLEGMPQERVEKVADTFASLGALQCGYCTPGIVVRTMSMVDKKGADLTREEAARHLGAHLCRCTGYVKVLDAIEAVAKSADINAPAVGGVGSGGVKYEAARLASGKRGYVDDMRVDGMLHGALVLSEHARADILAIDTSAAEAVPGVVRVLTAADIPGVLKTGIIYNDWPLMIPVGGRTSYLGDVIATVVAEDREVARRAAALVKAEYNVLKPFVDADEALASSEDAVWGLDGNVLSISQYTRGDVDAAIAASAHVITETFQTQRVEHAFLEPESTLVVPSVLADGRRHLQVYSGTQGVWDDQRAIAAHLAIDMDQVTVELVSNGGGFGGKEDMANQGQTALASWLLDKPVKITSTREQSLLMHAKRHGIRLEYTVGCDADGHLTGMRAKMIGDSGPYASVGMKVLERAAGHATGPYRFQACAVHATAVRTNNPVCGAFRGFGANQAQFAMEGCLDRLAEKVGISGWEIRKRNVIKPGEVWGPGQVMDDGAAGAEVCLDTIKSRYDAAVAAGKAVGLGLGLKNSGLGNGFNEVCGAVVRFNEDNSVEVRHAWTEMGQGVHSVALQVAVEELKIDPARIKVIVDTTRPLGDGQTTGSRGTVMASGSVMEACKAALADGCKTGIDYTGEWRVDWTNKLGSVENPIIHSAFGYATQLVIGDKASGAIEKVVAVHDVGRAVNPLLCEGQIEGAVHMGLGYALTEEFPTDENGRPTNMTMRSLGIIRPKDMPEIETILVEVPQPRSPYGVKGVGEIGLVPTAGAVAAMMHQVDGDWCTTLPMGRIGSADE